MFRLTTLAVITVACVGCGQVHGPSTYRFVVANDRLFAIEEEPSYGTERQCFVTDDLGDHWNLFAAPDKTRALTGNGSDLFALTSRGGIWCRRLGSDSWSQIKLDSRRDEYTYSIAADSTGKLVTAGAHAVTLYQDDGTLLHRYGSDSSTPLFFNAFFAGPNEEYVVVEANPYSALVIDLQTQEMIPWKAGFDPKIPAGLTGLCHVRTHGEQFLASRHDGIYLASGVLEPWHKLSNEIRHEGYLGGNFCRDLISHDAHTDQWLVARNSGVHLMQGASEHLTVLTDAHDDHDDHDLILAIVPFRQYYFVSFSRLKNGCIGLRIPRDLSTADPLYRSQQPSK